MRARQLILGILATVATALPAAAQSVYVYPRYVAPPVYYPPPVYAPPPAYAYPPRYYAPPPRYYAPPTYVAPYGAPPAVEYDYPHRSQPHSPDRPTSDTGRMPGDPYQPLVLAIQQELVVRGYDPGPATGQLDPRTDDAIRRYQQDSGLPVSGRPSQELLDHMRYTAAAPNAAPSAYPPSTYPAPPPPQPSAVRSDATVAWVQDALNRRGYNVGPPDGILGQRTRQAIERFKRDSGMPVDSLINELLIARLRT